MSGYEAVNEASKTVQKQIYEAEEKIGETTRQVQNEWAKEFEEMSRTVVSRASLTACRSPADAVSAYQEWLSEEMSAAPKMPVTSIRPRRR
jgi:hypothetical protein